MRCTNHATRESSGYCTGCGSFFCEECLLVCDDGRQYCARCRTSLGKKSKYEEVAREAKLATKLLVKFKNGTELHGTTYKIDPQRLGFNMMVRDARGNTTERYVEFADVKYVALVESLSGEKSLTVREYQPKGSEVAVTFRDGETLSGFTLKHYNDKEPRFSVIPESRKDNRISTIIERSAVAHMALGRIPKAQELRSLVDNGVKRLILHYYWRHPDLIITINELAERLGRAPSAIDRELDDFIKQGIIHRLATSGQLRFTPSRDPVVREMVVSMGQEIDRLYFRKPAPPPKQQAPVPPKPSIRWPL